jgi:O-antigen biosynthesis protein
MRICVVSPRYGPEIVGGAESVARGWAKHLSERGHDVSVITTCALNHHTWRNELSEGDTTIDGVRVTRYLVTVAPDRELIPRLFSGISRLPPPRQRDLLQNTGYSETLLDGISQRAGNVDAFIFTPYLYPSTVYGALVAPEKSLIMPALHDEERARLPLVLNTLKRVAGLLFLSQPEADLAKRILTSMPDSRVVGTGVETPPPEPLPDIDFIAYAGRYEGLKNYPLLLKWMAAYRSLDREHQSLRLVTMGGGAGRESKPSGKWLSDLGQVSTQRRQSVFAAATATANLSVNESFSLVLMESWLAGTPLIVHANCAVTKYHCQQSGGGIWVSSAAEFCEAGSRLRGDRKLRDTLGRQGREYVLREYSWNATTTRLETAIAELVA